MDTSKKTEDVSIHAPRVGRDVACAGTPFGRCSFNPRAPRGARHLSGALNDCANAFQSTRPAWGATVWENVPGVLSVVSIHAPRVGRDLRTTSFSTKRTRFQSTRPAWGATTQPLPCARAALVSIHAPRVGRDISCVR